MFNMFNKSASGESLEHVESLMPTSLFAAWRKNMEFMDAVVTARATKAQFATPYTVVLDLPTLRLLEFSLPDNKNAKQDAGCVATVVVAPYAGHNAAIADFLPQQSLVRTLLEHTTGRVLVTEWKSATIEMRDFSIATYVGQLQRCAEEIIGKDAGKGVNLVGLCQGGWLSAMLAAYQPSLVNSLVLAGSPIDTHAGDGFLKRLVLSNDISAFQSLVALGGGLMRGRFMLSGWKSMNPYHHFVGKYLTFYKKQDEPEFAVKNKAFESWYETTVDLPGEFYLQVVRELFQENRLARGTFVLNDKTLQLKDIKCPIYMLAGEADEITTPEQIFDAAPLFGTPPQKIVKKMVPGGHIGLFMGSATLHNFWPAIGAWLEDRRTNKKTT